MTGAGLLFASFMATGVAVAADPQAGSSDQAIALVDRPLAGHLEGSASGSFAYYKVDYPGDGSVATVNMQVTPDDVFILQNAGMVFFGLDGTPIVSGGQQPKLSPNVSGNVIFNDPNKRGSYVVQVYNYNPQTAIDFTIWVAGVPVPAAPAAPAAPIAPAPVASAPAVPAAPSNPSQPTGVQSANSFSGHLNGGGETALYEFTYPGDQSVFTIGVNVTPNDPAVLQNAGFKVYGPVKDEIYATGGTQPGLTPNVLGNIISTDPGTYVIQVYNFSQAPIGYTVSLSTAPPPGEVLAGQGKTP